MLAFLLFTLNACAQIAPATQQAEEGKLPHVEIDRQNKQVRVDCEALGVEMPLEFFCVVSGGPEHEAALRSPVKPSHLHLALLMLGIEPGKPVSYSETTKKMIPPQGPPLQIFCEFEKDGKAVSIPAYRLMRNVQTKKEMPPMTWIFVGSSVMEDGVYAADVTGYLVSVVNFELTVIDIPNLASSSNELLEWEINPDVVPPAGTKVSMVIRPSGTQQIAAAEPAKAQDDAVVVIRVDGNGVTMDGKPVEIVNLKPQLQGMKQSRPITARLVSDSGSSPELMKQAVEAVQMAGVALSVVKEDHSAAPSADVARMQALRRKWQDAVGPHADAMRQAAQTHYDIIRELRREQQRLIDEADRIQRLIDELEQAYQDATTPKPQPISP